MQQIIIKHILPANGSFECCSVPFILLTAAFTDPFLSLSSQSLVSVCLHCCLDWLVVFLFTRIHDITRSKYVIDKNM